MSARAPAQGAVGWRPSAYSRGICTASAGQQVAWARAAGAAAQAAWGGWCCACRHHMRRAAFQRQRPRQLRHWCSSSALLPPGCLLTHQSRGGGCLPSSLGCLCPPASSRPQAPPTAEAWDRHNKTKQGPVGVGAHQYQRAGQDRTGARRQEAPAGRLPPPPHLRLSGVALEVVGHHALDRAVQVALLRLCLLLGGGLCVRVRCV
jgi:hypothetical protein